ncbi:MAG: long-chain fatty acid--CoA ligase [Bdellovibrionaceae bacterium]|nr:long-chain fatty acid--CoA ligase [Bdellovibrionales bacterium]MCB9084090.1 long-chain fatty acid--CoA ligase [Pseudobdellovibrionaceae bacterium]
MEIDWLNRWNRYAPDRVVVKVAETGAEYTYRHMWEHSQKIARALSREQNIGEGDRVALVATNKVETLFLFFALQRLGAILVPVNFRLTAREVSHIVNDSGAKVLIMDEAFSGLAKELELSQEISICSYQSLITSWQDEPLPEKPLMMAGNFESPVMILYTSGTTGFPKGAIITHKMIFWNSVNTSLRLSLTDQDVSLVFLPFFHTGGWNVLTTPLIHKGGKLIFLSKFEADQVLSVCQEDKVSILFGVPTTMEMMARSSSFESVDLSSIRYAIVGGEPMPIEAIHKWQAKGIPIRQGYGLTEYGPNVFSLNEEHSESKIGSIGFANFYVETKVVDEENRSVLAGEIGELCLRGPACTPGYWNNPEATAQTIRDGWLHTGDLVRFDEEGFHYVVGRKKDMYISGGENVYPVEVEKFIRSLDGVLEAAVIGVADDQWGEVGKAFVVMQPGESHTADELRSRCLAGLAKFKVPKYFQFSSELPKGDTGKILKRALDSTPI